MYQYQGQPIQTSHTNLIYRLSQQGGSPHVGWMHGWAKLIPPNVKYVRATLVEKLCYRYISTWCSVIFSFPNHSFPLHTADMHVVDHKDCSLHVNSSYVSNMWCWRCWVVTGCCSSKVKVLQLSTTKFQHYICNYSHKNAALLLPKDGPDKPWSWFACHSSWS